MNYRFSEIVEMIMKGQVTYSMNKEFKIEKDANGNIKITRYLEGNMSKKVLIHEGFLLADYDVPSFPNSGKQESGNCG